ncbi:hypothetical protein PINS_up006259 [Pythium insidiosum]|nr:hypothetical protein PINS_up006259 [Pythium insidiosum]
MERITVLPNGQCRRGYSPENALFARGNELRELKFYRDLGLEMEERPELSPEPVMRCHLFSCDAAFATIAAYEEHYDLVHRNVCRECQRSFLSFRLLDIHISETHDAFFKVLSKRQPMYVCLVDGCTEVFKHNDKRMRHLIQTHDYPATFSFFLGPKRATRAANTRRQRATEDANGGEPQTDASIKPKTKKKKNKRVEKKLATEVETDDVLQHTKNDTQIPSSTTDIDMEIDDLHERMKQLHVPKSISFGRRRRR